MGNAPMTTTKQPLPWWADPNSNRNQWAGDYSRTYNPTGFTDPNDPNYRYQTWLAQQFDTSGFNGGVGTSTQGQYGGESGNPTTQAPVTIQPSSQVPFSATESSVTSQIPASGNAAQQAMTDPNYSRAGNPNPTETPQGDAWDGFARRYAGENQDLLFSEYGPGIILRDYLNQDGKTNRVNQEGDLKRYADSAPMIYDILMAGNLDPSVTGDDDVINWMAQMFQNMGTEGGRMPDLQTMMQQFYAGLNNEKSNIYAKTMLDENGDAAGTSQQISAINALLPLLGVYSGNYNYVDGRNRQAGRLGNEYASKVANGDAAGKTYAQYLQENFLR